jgi:hypothetical protein
MTSARPTHPQARVEASDGSHRRRISEELLALTFVDGLWGRINAAAKTMLDEYEEDEIPVDKLQTAADEIRAVAEVPTIEAGLRQELVGIADFLDDCRAKSVAVWVFL